MHIFLECVLQQQACVFVPSRAIARHHAIEDCRPAIEIVAIVDYIPGRGTPQTQTTHTPGVEDVTSRRL